MPTDSDIESRLDAEIGHVLFLDMVEYSLQSMEGQDRAARELAELVSATPEFRRAHQRGELVVNDTGDGMALVFFRDPLSPVTCATEIARALRSHTTLRVRMGVHSGPVTRRTDLSGKVNVSGAGINFAARVMDKGDTDHILLSAAAAEMVRPFEAWANCLFPLGVAEVKHGVKIQLYNLVMGGVGNPLKPSKLDTGTAPQTSPGPMTPPAPVVAPREVRETLPEPPKPTPILKKIGEGHKVSLLYKRGAQPDERLVALLADELEAQGFEVFTTRRVTTGDFWMSKLEREIPTSDAVIILLSTASMQSEMVEHEVAFAYHHSVNSSEKKPHLIPVRVACDEPLTGSLSAALQPLHSLQWQGTQDDAKVVEEVGDTILNPPRRQEGSGKKEKVPVGGGIPVDSPFYVHRPTDADFLTAITRRDSIVLVKGARQMGKTSLLARGLYQARESGAKVVLCDFQALSASQMESADTLYKTLAESLADQLDLDVFPEDVWNAARSANTNLERYLRKEVLGALGDTPLVWGLDEVDRLFTCPFGSEVFGLFRSWHNKRALDPTGPWSRLTLAIAYATEAHLFITDLNQSPFNVGTRLTLDDFTEAQVAELNSRYEYPPLNTDGLRRFYARIGGQPFLAQRGLYEFANGLTVPQFEQTASDDEGLYGDHLRRLVIALSQDKVLTEVVRGLLNGIPCPTPESFYRLRAAGLVRGENVRESRLRCPLYEEYLIRHLH